MKKYKWIMVLALILIIAAPVAGKGPGGSPGDIPDTGELFGDLYVILRDQNGVPMLSEDGCIQPISSMDGEVTLATIDGDLTIVVWEGEPFALPTYTDTAGDLVECELAEGMADWVQAVDFGRLNLGRAPDAVINHAFDEAIKNMNIAAGIDIDPAGRLVLTFADGTEKTIDSPAENLALYIKMMKDGHWITTDPAPAVRGKRPPGQGPPEGDGPSTEDRPVLSEEAVALLPLAYRSLGDEERTNADLTVEQLQLAASLMAAAADKTGSITLDKVMYINSIYGINQLGSVLGEVEGKTYFDFGAFTYGRNLYAARGGGPNCDAGEIWVLQPELDNGTEVANHYVTQCMPILGRETDPSINAVRFTDMVEAYTTTDPDLEFFFNNNVRGFTQAADDALQVLEYIHNYKVPEVLYPEEMSAAAVEGNFSSTAPDRLRSPK